MQARRGRLAPNEVLACLRLGTALGAIRWPRARLPACYSQLGWEPQAKEQVEDKSVERATPFGDIPSPPAWSGRGLVHPLG